VFENVAFNAPSTSGRDGKQTFSIKADIEKPKAGEAREETKAQPAQSEPAKADPSKSDAKAPPSKTEAKNAPAKNEPDKAAPAPAQPRTDRTKR
jgi:hypothetical protein